MDIVNLAPAAQQLADLIVRAEDGDLTRPTPCPAYTVGDLIDHVGGMTLAFTSAANKDAGPQVPFGPSRQPPGDAPPLDRVVALAGRDPHWSPR